MAGIQILAKSIIKGKRDLGHFQSNVLYTLGQTNYPADNVGKIHVGILINVIFYLRM